MFTARTNGVSTRCCFPFGLNGTDQATLGGPHISVGLSPLLTRSDCVFAPTVVGGLRTVSTGSNDHVGPAQQLIPSVGLPSASSHPRSDGTFTDIAGIGHRHCCRRGQDVLIPVATLAFAPERQVRASRSPSPLVFLPVSTHFTATPEIPSASPAFKLRSFHGPLPVEPGAFTVDFRSRLRALYAQ